MLSHAAPKQPIKKLPASIDITESTTVEQVKIAIAQATGFSDPNRIGLFYPSTKKTLKNRKARIVDEQEVEDELLVKDLGQSVPRSKAYLQCTDTSFP